MPMAHLRIALARGSPRVALALALGAALVAAAGARAEDYVRDGWYAGGRGVVALSDFDVQGSAGHGLGFNLFAGYRMYRSFASDFEFEYIDSIPVDAAGTNPFVRTFDLAWNFRAYPLARLFDRGSAFQRAQPYLSAGPSWQWAEVRHVSGDDPDDGSFAARLGGGLELYLTENVVLTADGIYTLSTADVRDFRYWSIGWGFQYRFGAGEAAAEGEEEEEGEQ
jgi:opacity protein-like surface antigen